MSGTGWDFVTKLTEENSELNIENKTYRQVSVRGRRWRGNQRLR